MENNLNAQVDRAHNIRLSEAQLNYINTIATNTNELTSNIGAFIPDISNIASNINSISDSITNSIIPLLANINANLIALLARQPVTINDIDNDTQIVDSLEGTNAVLNDLVSNNFSATVEKMTPITLEATIEDVLLPEISATIDAINDNKDTTNAALKSVTDGQKAETTAIIANAEKIEQAKKRDARIGNNIASTPTNKTNEKLVREKPKLDFNLHQFMNGFFRMFGALFNPVAVIGSFIIKMIPYFIIGFAFFKGVWSRLSDNVKSKLTILGKKLALTIGILFLLFKGIPAAIYAKTLLYNQWRMVKATALYTKEMFLWLLKVKHQYTKHTAEMTNIVNEKKFSLLAFLKKIAVTIIEGLQNLIVFLFRMSTTLLAFLAIIAIVGVIIFLVYKFWDIIIKGVKTIGQWIMSALGAIPEMIGNFFSWLGSVIMKILNPFSDTNKKTEQKQTDNKNNVKVNVDNGIFEKSFEKIIEPINMINNMLKNIDNTLQAMSDKLASSFTNFNTTQIKAYTQIADSNKTAVVANDYTYNTLPPFKEKNGNKIKEKGEYTEKIDTISTTLKNLYDIFNSPSGKKLATELAGVFGGKSN